MTTEPTAPKRRKRALGVHRKGPGRGWVFRWTEWDPVAQKRVKRTSPEHATALLAQQAAVTHRDQRTIEKIQQKDQRRRGGAQPFAIILERWAASRLSTGQAGPIWTHEVTRTLTALAAARRWDTVAEITADDVDAWITQRQGVAVEGPLGMLKGVLNYARRVLRQPIDPWVLEISAKSKNAGLAVAMPHEPDELLDILARADAQSESVGTLARHLATLGHRPKTAVNMTCGHWDEVNRLLTIRFNKNGIPFRVFVADDELALRFSRLTANRARAAALYVSPEDGTSWAGKHGSAARLSVWWRRTVTGHLARERRGIYRLVDTAVSRMRAAGWDGTAIAAVTGKRTNRVHDLYDAATAARMRELYRRLDPLPAASREPGMFK